MGRVVVGAYREAVSCVEARMGVVAFPFKGTWDTGQCWLEDCGITACVQSRHMERSWGARVATLGSLDQNGQRSWAVSLPQELLQELGSVLAPGTMSLLLAALELSMSAEHSHHHFYRHYSSHCFIRMEASYGLVSLNTDATYVPKAIMPLPVTASQLTGL